jgi:glycosyltransferase involved in cell wall biosynthesis
MISVIMAAYNASPYIKSAIDSVINQSMEKWELLIINDGSTDDTGVIIQNYTDTRIKYFFQENQGVSKARNVGLLKMSGDYFCFLDADDYLPRESLELRHNKFMQNPEIDFVDGIVHIYNHNLSRKTNEWKPEFKGNPLNQLLNISGLCFFSPTWMIRRKVNRTYCFNEKLSHGEDLLFFIELALEGGRYDFIEDAILFYRKGHSSAMKDLSGLENGYHLIYNSIRNNKNISSEQAEQFKKTARKIIFKSYLGNYRVINALLSVTRNW